MAVGLLVLIALRKLWKIRRIFQKTHSSHRFVRTAMTLDDSSVFPSYFVNAQGLALFTRRWLVPEPRAVVFIVHGLSEHCSRYEHVARLLNSHGIAVFGMDHQGHGLSHGDRCHVEHFDDYVTDVLEFTHRVQSKYSFDKLPKYLLGHSLGGQISLRAALREPTAFSGMILSAPLIFPDPDSASPVMRFLCQLFSRIAPKLTLDALVGDNISTNQLVVSMYKTDTLISLGSVKALFAHEVLNVLDDTVTQLQEITMPILILQGDQDRLVVPEGANVVYENVSSQDKALEMYPGLYHELFNESDSVRPGIMNLMCEWLVARS